MLTPDGLVGHDPGRLNRVSNGRYGPHMTQQRPALKKWQIVAGGIVAVVVAIIVTVGAITEKNAPTTPAAANTPAATTTQTPATSEPVGPEPTPTESQAEAVLTVENSKDLAALVAAKEDSDLSKEFAAKYQARTIEFDGTIAGMQHHGDYKTRYDILVFAGDNIEEGATGPNFQFRDVNVVSDLQLTGPNIPDTIDVGQKLHITAQVAEYDENAGLFLLDPVSTGVR